MNIRVPRTDLNQGSQQTGQVSGTSLVENKSDKSAGTSGSSSDTVTFTTTASEMLKLEESLANIPDIDNSRVAAIKASIAEGKYEINPEKIVDSLLSIEKDLT
ncbi:MAG: flagellar biosynthesis anti-sigma factor FlgM [Porticoccus sp.]|nr:flagellar biosynthesis anti-sigma factor FlgM [Porticoccus sp.]